MPVVFRHRGFTFFFYSNEGTPREPIHIHVEKNDIEANKDRIQRAWNEFFR